MQKTIKHLLLIALLAAFGQSQACTNFLITKGASVDGSTPKPSPSGEGVAAPWGPRREERSGGVLRATDEGSPKQ